MSLTIDFINLLATDWTLSPVPLSSLEVEEGRVESFNPLITWLILLAANPHH